MIGNESNMVQADPEVVSINFGAIWTIIKREWWLILLITGLAIGAGAYYAFTAREEFVSEGRILPEISGGGGSSLGGIASLIGMGGFELGLKNSTDAIRPDLYPSVLSSNTFFLELLKQRFVNREGKEIGFEAFYKQKIEDGKEITPEASKPYPISSPGVLNLSRLQESRIKDLRSRVVANIDKKSGVISITSKMPDPAIAAQIASYAMSYLTEYVTDYRVRKARKDVDFYSQKLASAKGKFYSQQEQKAAYNDAFQLPTIRLQSADVKRERIEAEYRMSSNVYAEFQKKLEESKIKLQHETPVFQVLDLPAIPTLKSEPRKAVILAISGILGGLLAFLVALVRRRNYRLIFT